jgi:hypothetical protein
MNPATHPPLQVKHSSKINWLASAGSSLYVADTSTVIAEYTLA